MKNCTRQRLCLLGILLWLPLNLFAAEPSLVGNRSEGAVGVAASEADVLRDPAALAELKRATDYLTALPRFHLAATVAYDVIQDDGRRLQFEKHGDIYLQRPDRLFAEIHLDDGRWRQLWYDGATLSLASLSKKVHTTVRAPGSIDAVLDMLEGLFNEPLPLADLLYSDLNALGRKASEADVVGDSTVKGRLCRQLAFRGETVDWQLWVEQGETPLIRKLVISYRQEVGTPQYAAWIDTWETPAEPFGGDRFTFVAPFGSQQIGVLVSMPRRIEEGGRP